MVRASGENGRDWIWNVAVMWLAVLIAIMGMSLVIPFLPLYLKDLHVPESETSLWAGLVGGANFLCAALFAPLWGTLADRYGRKPMAIRALIGLGVAVGAMGWAHNVYQLFFLRMLQGAFGGFVAEAVALVGSSVPKENVGSALGFLQTAVVSGNLVGPLVGGELSHYFRYRTTFRITGAARFLAMILVLLLVRENRKKLDAEPHRGIGENVRDLLQVPQLRWMLITVICTQCGLMLVNPQISLFVRDLLHGAGGVERWAGWVTAAPAFTSLLMSPVWGRAGDRKGHAGMLALALAGSALLIPWAGLAASVWHLLLVRFLLGAFTSASNPSTHSVVAHSVDERRTAGAFSLLSSANMLGSCLGPFLSGWLATVYGVRPLFAVTGVLLFAASTAAFRVRSMGTRKPFP